MTTPIDPYITMRVEIIMNMKGKKEGKIRLLSQLISEAYTKGRQSMQSDLKSLLDINDQ